MKIKALFAAFALLTSNAWANNIQISDVSLMNHDETEFHVLVRFDISWENSWRTSSAPNNWDAAWVFVKYRNASTGLWEHARLHNNTGHTAPAGSMIETGFLDPSQPFFDANNPGIGVFIHRNADGTGTFTASGVELRWNYWANNIAFEDIAEVRVFGVEMVFVPEGSFHLGTGGSEYDTFMTYEPNPYYTVSSEGAIPTGYWLTDLHTSTGLGLHVLVPEYPKGFAAFYIMKHEIAQKDYVDFLNTLTRTQQQARTGTDLAPGVTSTTDHFVMSTTSTVWARNGIRCPAAFDDTAPISFFCDLNTNGVGNEPDDGQWVACNYLNWDDLIAYLDWSGLRPMSEMEYEKAARGPLTPVPDEYAWGSTWIRFGNYTVTDPGSMDEGVSDPATGSIGNTLWSGARIIPWGPGRVGLFATTTSDRVSAGAGYYGALELSGNVNEQTARLCCLYSNRHGDGNLNSMGNADTDSWPTASGSMLRGGAWNSPSVELCTSARYSVSASVRNESVGGRGVRIAPTTDCPGLGEYGAPCTPFPGAPEGSGTVDFDCTCVIACLADAGTLVPGTAPCYAGSPVTLTATPAGDAEVPPGSSTVYLLGNGISATIVGVSATPEFMVEDGLHSIHTLVYDPATFDLASIELGVTTALGISTLFVPDGSICGSISTGAGVALYAVGPC